MAKGRGLALAALALLSLMLQLTCTSSVGRNEAEEHMLYHDWVARHNRAFGVDFNTTDDVDNTRFTIFRDNLRFIDAHNARAGLGYRLGITAFTGLTHDEFRARYINGHLPAASPAPNGTASDRASAPVHHGRAHYIKGAGHVHASAPIHHGRAHYINGAGHVHASAPVHDNDSLLAGTTMPDGIPQSVDWRTAGAVAPVKSQGTHCGSCWAFSALSSVESALKLNGGELVPLSEQQIIDCVRSGRSKGCHFGYVSEAFDFVAANGACSEDSYPYTGSDDGHCAACPKASSIAGYEGVAANDEVALLVAVARQPVSVLIEGSGREFQHYSSGVFTGPCGTSVDHAIVAVGYGGASDVATESFWIMRNSWSSDWGEEGYVRMSRSGGSGGAGLCGLAMYASYPVVRRA